MRFRTSLLVGILALVGAVLLATVLAVSFLVDRSARREVAAGLSTSKDVFAEHFAQRQVMLRTESRVVAEEPRLKAVVATEEVTHETVLGVALELRRALQSDVFLMTDAQGQLLADVADPNATGFDMSKNPLIAAALADGEASSVLTDDRGVYQMHARRLAFGATTVGVVAIGYRLDGKVAESAARQTACTVVIQVDGKTSALAGISGDVSRADASHVREEMDAAVRDVDQTRPMEVTLRDHHYLAVSSALPGYSGSHNVRYVLLRSLDDALAARAELLRALYLIFAIAGAVAIVFAFTLSNRLAKPLGELVSFTKRIAGGDMKRGARIDGALELATLGDAMNEMATEIDEGRRKLAETERIAKEMEIAARIQTSILPKQLKVKNLEIAASMHPATEVGGDYYDFLPVNDGCWIAIGDVAGHGLKAGLVMMMIQSIVSALVRAVPSSKPSVMLQTLNATMFENVRERLLQDEHATLSLLKYTPGDGRFVWAGAHEDILLCRSSDGSCERIPTPGTWLGGMEDISEFTVDTTLEMKKGDVLVLYTDGLVEAKNASGALVGIDRVVKVVQDHRKDSVEEIRERIVKQTMAWGPTIVDDITVVVIRYVG